MITMSAIRQLATSAALACAVAAPSLLPAQAHAEWVHRWGWGWRRVAPPPVVVLPPRIVYTPAPVVVARPYTHWVRPHYNWRGVWIPGHWA